MWNLLHDGETQAEIARTENEETILEEFVREMADYRQRESDVAERMQTLRFWRGKLAAKVKRLHLREKFGTLHSILDRAIHAIDCELDIINMQLEHREIFATESAPEVPNFNLHFVGKSKDFGLVGLAEVVLALSLTNEIVGASGRPAKVTRLARAFEYLLDMKFGDISKHVAAILVNRKPYNRTKALDYLRALVLREEKRRREEKSKQ